MNDQEYLKMKKDATIQTVNKKGHMIARYKPGTLVTDSKKNVYEVQGDGSWKRKSF